MRGHVDQREFSVADDPSALLGLGLAALGRPGYLTLGHGADLAGRSDPASLEAHTHRMLDEAWANGVGYLDAARSYGRAEAFLAGWLAKRGFAEDARRPIIASKWGYRYTADWQVDAEVHEVKELDRAQLDRQFAESRDLLGDYLDVYQIHSATISSGVLTDGPTLDRLRELRASGLTIGLTATGPDQSETIRQALEIPDAEGRPLFEVVQATWNVLEPSAGPALAAAAANGAMVVVKEALANGRLTGRDPSVAFATGQHVGDVPLDQAALAAALTRPWATVVLSGAATIDQLRSNIGAMTEGALAAGSTLASVNALAEDPGRYWQTRADLTWT